MKIFISWSGDHSRKVAELLKSWLEFVFQDVEAWMSKEDISKGEIWFTGLSDTLAKTDFGILCLTSENVAAPWILFEAGALSKGLSKNRVCPLVIDFEPQRLTPPLSQFNAARTTKEEMQKLVEAINAQAERVLPPEKLRATFERWWDYFESKFSAVTREQKAQPPPPQRSTEDMIVEILDTVRALQKFSQTSGRARRPLSGHFSDLSAIVSEGDYFAAQQPIYTFQPTPGQKAVAAMKIYLEAAKRDAERFVRDFEADQRLDDDESPKKNPIPRAPHDDDAKD